MTTALFIVSLALLFLFFISRVYPNVFIFWTSHKTKNMSFVYLFLSIMLFIPAAVILNSQPQVSDSPYIDMDSQISSYDVDSTEESSSEESEISYTEPDPISVNKNLDSGNYSIGIDIPSGTYNLTAVKGGGNVMTDSGSLNEIMGVASKGDMYSPTYNNLTLYDGDILEIRNVTLNIKSDDASGAALGIRANSATQSYTFSTGNYTVGKDFDEGVYNISLVSGNGNVQTEDGVLNLVMGSYDDDMYIKKFTNAPMVNGDILELKGNVKVKLTPSK